MNFQKETRSHLGTREMVVVKTDVFHYLRSL